MKILFAKLIVISSLLTVLISLGSQTLAQSESVPDDIAPVPIPFPDLDTSEEGSDEIPNIEADIDPFPQDRLSSCPAGRYYQLEITHEFTFSPGNSQEIRVQGKTIGLQWINLYVNRRLVSFPQDGTDFEYEYQGRLGPAAVQGKGLALIQVESAECQNGVITLTITETNSDSEPNGTMTVPGVYSGPYYVPFPHSRHILSLALTPPDSWHSNTANYTNAGDSTYPFDYTKNWILIDKESAIIPDLIDQVDEM
jgi:hypothetical protein